MNKGCSIKYVSLIKTFLIILVFLYGCAYQRPVVKAPLINNKISGKYHKVEKGQTLWGIAKAYGVSLDELVRLNRIPNAAQIEEGQLIFIPKKTSFVSTQDPLLTHKKFIWPVRGKVISYFGNTAEDRVNKGIDIRVASSTDVSAAGAGKIVFSDYLQGYGQTLIIDHLDGFFSIYSNLSKRLVKFGDNIYQGQMIAKLDGNDSVVHFEIRREGEPKNPLYYLP
jgi:murein DD-endopeptidase MepM/ murein hydrolase activator NlpD